MKILLTIACMLLASGSFAQNKKSVVIGSRTTRPNALLIVNPENADQGVLLPQLTTAQRLALKPSSPTEDGLMVFDTNTQAYFHWSNGSWFQLRSEKNTTRYHIIDPLHFRSLKPDNSSKSSMVIFESDNTFVTARPNGSGEEIMALVDLPHQAVVQEATLYYVDNHDKNIRVELVRRNLWGQSDEIFSWESSGASPAVTSKSFTDFKGHETIDLESYTYRVIITFDVDEGESVDTPAQAKQRIYGVRIKYKQ